MARRGRIRLTPTRFHGAVGLALSLLGGVGLMLLFRAAWGPFHLLAAWMAAVNLTAFAYFGYDKLCARVGARRVPEAVLHGLAFAGGSLGAYGGMQVFRHKTIKSSFRIFFWFIVVMQLLLIAAVIYRLIRG